LVRFLILTNLGEPFDGRACLGAFHKVRLLGEVFIFLIILYIGWFRKSLSCLQQNE